MWISAIAWALFLLYGGVHAEAAEEVLLNNSVDALPLNRPGMLSYALSERDTFGPPAPEEFKPFVRPDLGHTRKAVWLRFKVKTAKDLDRSYLLEARGFPDYVALYREGEASPLSATGALIPVSQRPVPNNRILLPLPLRPGEEAAYLVRLTSESPIGGRLWIYSKRGVARSGARQSLAFGAYFGAVLALILFNILLFVTGAREKSLLCYAFVQATVHLAFPAQLLGYSLLMWPESPHWDITFRYLAAGLGAIFMARLGSYFFSLKETSPKLHKVMLALQLAAVVLIAVAMWQDGHVNVPGAILAVVLMSLITAIAVQRTALGDSAAGFFIGGNGVFFLAALTYYFANHGILNLSLPFPPLYVFLVGNLLDSLLMAVALAEKIKRERTLRLRAQNELLKSMEHARNLAQSTSEAKDRFLLNMSHELRTPLNGIVASSELLLSESGLTKEQAELIADIRNSADSLTAIVGDILDFANVETGRMKVKQLPFTLQNSLHEVKALMGIAARKKGISLKFTIHDGLPQKIVGDPFRTRQILMNVIGNAVKFTRTGEVKVEIGLSEVDKTMLNIHVEDTGSGIPKSVQENLFEPFFQGDSSLARRHGGTGLGLSLSRRLARLLGGDIRLVHSEENGGSHFHITLPADSLAGFLHRDNENKASAA